MGKNNRQRRLKKNKVKESRAKNKQKISSKQNHSPIYKQIESPFKGLGEQKKEEVIRNLSERAKRDYLSSLLELDILIEENNPLALLALLVTYGLTIGIGDDGVNTTDTSGSALGIHQAHVEIFQALILRADINVNDHQRIDPKNVEESADKLKMLLESHSYLGFENVLDFKPEKEKQIQMLQHALRTNTKGVRNWGYFSQVKDISKELYGFFNESLAEKFGFTVDQLFTVFEFLTNQLDELSNSRFQKFRVLNSCKDKKKLVLKYFELFEEDLAEAHLFIESEIFNRASREKLFAFFLNSSDQYVYEDYVFSPIEISKELSIDPNAVRRILEEFSMMLGELKEFPIDHLFLSNPTWLKPVIKIDVDKYFCILPQIFFSFVIPSIEKLILEVDKEKLNKRRSSYLENKVEEVINRRFPKANTLSGMTWIEGDSQYETDLITFIDSYILIVEAKSVKVSEPALRGAPSRIKRHVKEILIEPNVQSQRLKSKLELLMNNPSLDDPLREKLPVDLGSIHRVIRLSISLEDFGMIQSNVYQLEKTGWLPDDFDCCPTMNLADFETLFDFLDHPVQIIHYLERRHELESELNYMGDELDLMGLYIGTLFNVGDLDYKDNMIITGMSDELDRYYNSKDAGIFLSKPSPKLDPLFRGIVEQLEGRGAPRWTEIGVILNRFSPDDQRLFSKMVKKLKRNVRKNWNIFGHENTAVLIPPKSSEYALSYVMYCNKNSDLRDTFISQANEHSFEKKHVNRCLVIAKNIDRDDLHYHFIGLFEREEIQ